MVSPPVSAAPAVAAIRLALVDDEPVVRHGLAAVFGSLPDFHCVQFAAEHTAAVREAEFVRPDVALLDVPRNAADLSRALRLWRVHLPRVRLLLFDERVLDLHVRYVFRGQADGYATKRDSPESIVEVVRRCACGEPAFTPHLEPRLIATPRGWELRAAPEPGIHLLSAREIEVVALLAQGMNAKECAPYLGISPSTVENHKVRIMRKLKLRKVIELTRLAMREGLIPR